MNKKAQLSKVLPDFAGYAAYVIVFLVFLLLFNLAAKANTGLDIKVYQFKPFTSKTNEIIQDQFSFNSITANHILLNFLRTEIVDTRFSEKPIKMSDYVVLAAYASQPSIYPEKDYPAIKSQLDSYIKTFNGCYELKIVKAPKYFTIKGGETSKGLGTCSVGSPTSGFQTIKIPTKNNEIVEVTFKFGSR